MERASRASPDGPGFRRQVPIGPYIVDFACSAKMLIVEVDGSQHADAQGTVADMHRTAVLERDGWTVLRFWNHDVLGDIDGVCRHIVTVAGLAATDARAASPSGHLIQGEFA